MGDRWGSEDADFETMLHLHVAREVAHDLARARSALFPAWLAMWRRIARDFLASFVWFAATGEALHDHHEFRPVTDDDRDVSREYLQQLGMWPSDSMETA